VGRVASLAWGMCLCAAALCALKTPASARPLFEFFRDGITIVAEAPAIVPPSVRLSKVQSVSAKTDVERVLIPGLPTVSKSLTLTFSLVPGVSAFDETTSARFARIGEALPEAPLTASRLLTVSIRPRGSSFGLSLRFSGSGMLFLSADWTDSKAPRDGLAASLVPVVAVAPPPPAPDAVPLPASAPLLGGAAACLWALAFMRRKKRSISQSGTT
jgi:hypothetical protein